MDWKPLFKTFASILFGFALGLVAIRGNHPRAPFGAFGFGDNGPPGEKGPGNRGRGAAFLERFVKELGLSEEQRAKVQTIFENQRQKVEALHQEVFPRFDGIREETRQSVRGLLTPEQQTKFDKLHAKREARRKEMLERRKEKRGEPSRFIDGPGGPEGNRGPGGPGGPPPFEDEDMPPPPPLM